MTESLYLSHILVPIDGSECSRFAAEHALRIAQAYAAEILFVHAVDEQLVAELAQRESDDGQQQVLCGDVFIVEVSGFMERLPHDLAGGLRGLRLQGTSGKKRGQGVDLAFRFSEHRLTINANFPQHRHNDAFAV